MRRRTQEKSYKKPFTFEKSYFGYEKTHLFRAKNVIM